jgi:hypothetical protein
MGVPSPHVNACTSSGSIILERPACDMGRGQQETFVRVVVGKLIGQARPRTDELFRGEGDTLDGADEHITILTMGESPGCCARCCLLHYRHITFFCAAERLKCDSGTLHLRKILDSSDSWHDIAQTDDAQGVWRMTSAMGARTSLPLLETSPPRPTWSPCS